MLLYFGILIAVFIFTKMCIIGKKLNFINCTIMLELGFEIINGSFMIYFFFNVGHINLFQETPDLVGAQCEYYITFWLMFWILSPILHSGIIFCRYVYVR